jgi:molecular chaperone DnaK
MSDEDIEKAVKEAAEFEAQDKKRKDAIDTRNDADSFVFQTEKALEEVGDKLDPADKSAVEADLAALKKLIEEHANAEEMTDSQLDTMKAAKEKLMDSAQKVFAKMYEQSQGQAGPDMGAGAGPDMGGAYTNTDTSADDDVVDADFKEV